MDARRLIAAACLVASLAALALLYVGGLVTYTPAVTAAAMQNIYLSRMLRFAIVIGVLQVVALAAVLSRPK